MTQYTIKEILICKRCNIEISIPSFPDELREEIVSLKRNKMPLKAINLIRGKSELGLMYSKALLDHICMIEGSCNRCKNDKFSKKTGQCPKCNSVYINW